MNAIPDAMQLNSKDPGRLCGHLAAAMARAFHGDKSDLTKMWVPDYDVGHFGELADALEDIGLVEPRPNSWPFFTMLPERMPDVLSGTLEVDDPRVARVIKAFIKCACGYELRPGARLQWGGWRNCPHDYVSPWFYVDGIYRAAMEQFVANGYAEREGESFRWTNGISFAMHP